MISHVIRAPFVDRIWCILTTFFALAVVQVNLRAYYAKLYPYASAGGNDTMLNIGIATIIALPLIGYFDEHAYKAMHGLVSATFFLGTVIYVNYYASMFWEYKSHFSSETNHIERI